MLYRNLEGKEKHTQTYTKNGMFEYFEENSIADELRFLRKILTNLNDRKKRM